MPRGFCDLEGGEPLLRILQRFLEDGYMKIDEPNTKTISTQVQFIVDDESRETNCDDDVDYDDKANNHGDCDGHDDDDDDDDDSHHEDDSDDDASSDGHSDNDDGTDPICAMCDDGGKLLSCKGQCKRAFHPTKKHGRKSECETLGYTKAQRKRITTYICENCKYNQHQCFKCGDLEPSDEPNAKVFQCNNSSCGYFYHAKCIAQLLEPGRVDGELEKKISARMPFICPIHWCFQCKSMENKTQEALQLLACRRCPRSYHRQCLPREISFETKGKTMDHGATTCAWELPQIKFFYCLDHVDKATKTIRQNHIKFPLNPKYHRTRDPTMVKMTRKRKHSTDWLYRDLCADQNTSCVNQWQDITLENPVMDKDAEWDIENCRISGSVKTSEHHGSVKERDEPNKDTSCGNGERNGMFDSLTVVTDTEEDGCNLQSGEENLCGHDPLLQDGAMNMEGYSTHLCLANNKKPDVMETELNSPRCSDENRAAEIYEDRSKERPVSNTREELVLDMRGNSYESLQRNEQEVPTNPSPEPRMMDYCDSYPIINYQYGYEQPCHVNCSCVDYFTCRKYMPLLDGNGNLEVRWIPCRSIPQTSEWEGMEQCTVVVTWAPAARSVRDFLSGMLHTQRHIWHGGRHTINQEAGQCCHIPTARQ